jgi:hypothetical protein
MRVPFNRMLLALAAGLLVVSEVPVPAQNLLPPCPASRSVRWDMCFGFDTDSFGGRYVGDFRDGLRNGQGTFTFANGTRYVGEFREGNQHGQGTFTYPDGSRYVGEFRDNQRNGRGIYTNPSGERYIGEWRGGGRSGLGTYIYPDGAIYVGEYRDDVVNGQGAFISANGQLIQNGIWRDGELVEANNLPTPAVATQGSLARPPR